MNILLYLAFLILTAGSALETTGISTYTVNNGDLIYQGEGFYRHSVMFDGEDIFDKHGSVIRTLSKEVEEDYVVFRSYPPVNYALTSDIFIKMTDRKLYVHHSHKLYKDNRDYVHEKLRELGFNVVK